MIDFFLELPNKDKVTFIGIIITATTSFFTLLISLKLNKRSSYINSITNERINSMTHLKQNTANYISILKSFIFNEESNISISKLYNLKLHIEYQLNHLKEREKIIIQRMDNLYILINYMHSINQDNIVKTILIELTNKGIDMNRLPIPYTEDTRLGIKNSKEYLKRLISMELDLLEADLKNHIKVEWEKIKKEI
ncbi:hypothetical protein [Bacillus cereus]|uniref:hypothetical protein n=1 Tax=Bacillus cereus TaxID=1396 RepID=UPI001444014F|nr:hypothetical protein [Bacillus cereus]MDA1913637.1 hypothetical protein [Bacillus cereus]MDA2659758.1 hypothetical protein [Bacillus cereus]NKX61469.1 hypothetical protein [Bacillus cereus]